MDDDPAVLRSLRRVFRQEPFELLTTESPEEALEWVAGATLDPPTIFLDTLIRGTERTGIRPSVIDLSGRAREHLDRLGIDRIVPEPFRVPDFLSVLLGN